MDVFETVADPVRRAILRQLAAAPARVVDLAAAHPVSRPAVSRHLRVLAESGLVQAESRGRERHYRLDPAPLAALHSLLVDLGWPTSRAPVVEVTVRPPVPASALDALDTEVRRTNRDHRNQPAQGNQPLQEHQPIQDRQPTQEDIA